MAKNIKLSKLASRVYERLGGRDGVGEVVYPTSLEKEDKIKSELLITPDELQRACEELLQKSYLASADHYILWHPDMEKQ